MHSCLARCGSCVMENWAEAGGLCQDADQRRGYDARIALSTFVRLVNDAWYGIIGISIAIGIKGLMIVLNCFLIYGRDHNEI